MSSPRSTIRERVEFYSIKDRLREKMTAPLPPEGSTESKVQEANLALDSVSDLQTQVAAIVPVEELRVALKDMLDKGSSEKTRIAGANLSVQLIKEITKLSAVQMSSRGKVATDPTKSMGPIKPKDSEANFGPTKFSPSPTAKPAPRLPAPPTLVQKSEEKTPASEPA